MGDETGAAFLGFKHSCPWQAWHSWHPTRQACHKMGGAAAGAPHTCRHLCIVWLHHRFILDPLVLYRLQWRMGEGCAQCSQAGQRRHQQQGGTLRCQRACKKAAACSRQQQACTPHVPLAPPWVAAPAQAPRLAPPPSALPAGRRPCSVVGSGRCQQSGAHGRAAIMEQGQQLSTPQT